MTTNITCLIGIPGSGKTTWRNKNAKKNDVIISRDDYREEIREERGLARYKFNTANESEVNDRVWRDLTIAIANDRDVIMDETFCNLKTLIKFETNTMNRYGPLKCNLEYVIMDDSFNVDLCHKRNTDRGASVPYEVIERMHSGFIEVIRYLDMQPSWLVENKGGKTDAIIVDIDGTIANHEGVRSPFDWSKVGEDKPKQQVIDVITAFAKANEDVMVIVMSGRDGVCEPQTREWLNKYFPIYDMLVMRTPDDWRKDYIVKMELFDKHVNGVYNVIAAFDDRRQVVRYWRRALGIQVFQVEDGLF